MSNCLMVGHLVASLLLCPIFFCTVRQKLDRALVGEGPWGAADVGVALVRADPSEEGETEGMVSTISFWGVRVEVVKLQGTQLSVQVCPVLSHLFLPMVTR